jgi:hypothetical protein
LPEAISFGFLRRHVGGLQRVVVGRFGFCRWDVPNRLEQAAMVEPVACSKASSTKPAVALPLTRQPTILLA